MAKITSINKFYFIFLAASICQATARFGNNGGRREKKKTPTNRGGGGNDKNGDQTNGDTTIRNLFNHHELIDRDSAETPDGIEAFTTSENEEVAEWIKTHVEQMEHLMHDTEEYIRKWDPLFEAAFDLREFHDITVEYLENGVHVVQSVAEGVEGDEWECAKAIILAHANVVDNFASIGQEEAEKIHLVPSECDGILV